MTTFGAVLAMSSRSEMALLVPMGLTAAFTFEGALRARLSDRWGRWGSATLICLGLPLAVRAWLGRDAAEVHDTPWTPLVPFLVGSLPSAALLWLSGRGGRAARVALGLALGGVAAATLWQAPWAFDGRWPTVWLPLVPTLASHPEWSPIGGHPVAWVLALAAAGAAWRRGRGAVIASIVTLFLAQALYQVAIGPDSVSFFVRVLHPGAFAVAFAAACWMGGQPSMRAWPPIPVALAVLVASWGVQAGFLGHPFPTQDEVLRLASGRRLLQPGQAVVWLAPSDLPEPVLPGDVYDDFRPAFGLAFDATTRQVTVREALADPASVVGGWWFRGLSCHQPYRLGRGVAWDAHDDESLDLAHGGRRFRIPLGGVLAQQAGGLHGRPRLTNDDIACVLLGEGLRCVAPQQDGCALWTCARTSGRPPPEFEEDLCAQMSRTFGLEAVDVVRTRGGSLDSTTFAVLAEHPVVGWFRIRGVRTPSSSLPSRSEDGSGGASGVR